MYDCINERMSGKNSVGETVIFGIDGVEKNEERGVRGTGFSGTFGLESECVGLFHDLLGVMILWISVKRPTLGLVGLGVVFSSIPVLLAESTKGSVAIIKGVLSV